MKLNEMKKIMTTNYTSSKIKNEVLETIRHYNDYTLDIRVYTTDEDNTITADLMVDVNCEGEYIKCFVVNSIELEEDTMNFWEFKSMAEKALSTKKNNLLKVFNNFKIGSTQDYNC